MSNDTVMHETTSSSNNTNPIDQISKLATKHRLDLKPELTDVCENDLNDGSVTSDETSSTEQTSDSMRVNVNDYVMDNEDSVQPDSNISIDQEKSCDLTFNSVTEINTETNHIDETSDFTLKSENDSIFSSGRNMQIPDTEDGVGRGGFGRMHLERN